MKNFTICFELFGKKLQKNVEAENEDHAMEILFGSLVVDSIKEAVDANAVDTTPAEG